MVHGISSDYIMRYILGDNMNEKEKVLFAKCLDLAGDLMSNRICNDPPGDWFSDWTQEELVEFDRQVNEWNTTPEEHDPEEPMSHWYDWLVLRFLASKIESETENSERQVVSDCGASAIEWLKCERMSCEGCTHHVIQGLDADEGKKM